MKKNKVILTRTGEEYTCKYLLDAADIVDTKVDMGMSGRFPQIIPYTLEEKDGQRTFVYQIGERMQMTEFLKKEINKKQMLTLLYNVLSALETFGMNMISLSYVAKDIQYIFVNPETLEVSFIVAGVDKEITDLNEVRDFVKAIICDATYFEMDRDNYVARLISFTNRRGTFSISDMKKYVDNLLLDMGIHIEEEKKQEKEARIKKLDPIIRKFAHILEFAIFTFFAAIFATTFDMKSLVRFSIVFVLCGIYALSDEIHQYFVPGRVCDIKDVALDVTGVFISAATVCLFYELYRRKAAKKANISEHEENTPVAV